MPSVIRGSGESTLGGALDVQGVLTYEDVTSVDAVGIITAREGIRVGTGKSISIGIDDPVSSLHIDNSLSGGPLVTFHQLSGSSSTDAGLEVETSSTGTYIQRWVNSSSEKARITGAGDVGIGTTIPAGKLQVGETGGSNIIITPNTGIDINDGAINLYQATDNVNATPFIISTDIDGTETEKLRFTAGGNLGIGTNNPITTLHIQSTNTSGDLTIERVGNNANGPELILRHISATPADNDYIGQITFSGRDDANNNTTVARIDGLMTDVTNGTEDGELVFNTRSNGTFAERLRITSTGQVSLGNNPTVLADAALHIELDGAREYLRLDAENGNNNAYIEIEADDNRRKAIIFKSGGTRRACMGVGDSDNASETTLFFSANDSTGGDAPHITIDSAGDTVFYGNPSIDATDLYYTNTYNTSSWATNSWYTAVPTGLSANCTYLVAFVWDYDGSGGSPYYLATQQLWSTVANTNGNNTENEVTPLVSTHTGGTGCRIKCRTKSHGNPNGPGELQVSLNWLQSGNNYLKVKVWKMLFKNRS